MTTRTFREIFNGNLTVMTLKGKKLHPNDIQEIRGFVMTYKGLATFAMTYKEGTFTTVTSVGMRSSVLPIEPSPHQFAP
jgi:hypothetical protein